MSIKTTIALNTGSQFIGKILTGGTTFLISILLARTLGPTGFGDFTKVTTYIPLFYLLVDFGLNAAFLQRESQETDVDKKKFWFMALIATRIIGACILMFLSLALLAFLPSLGSDGYSANVKFAIILFSPTILFQALLTSANALFQKNLRYDRATIAIGAGSIVSLLCIYGATQIFLPSVGVVISIIALGLGSFLSAGIALVELLSFRPFLWKTSFFSYMLPLLMTALPLGLTLILNVIYFRADSLILTVTRSTSDVGLYGFAYKLFEFPLVIPTFFMNALYPLLLLSLARKNTQEFLSRLKKSFLILLLSSICLVGIGWFLAPLITHVKNEFQPSILYFRILLLSLPIFFMTSLTMWTLVTLKKQYNLLFVYGTSMLVNVGLNSIFTPSYGPLAASIITVISEAVVLILSCAVLFPVLKKDIL